MATERWLMLGVEAGGDRQALHEVIRHNSLATAEAVSRGAAEQPARPAGGGCHLRQGAGRSSSRPSWTRSATPAAPMQQVASFSPST